MHTTYEDQRQAAHQVRRWQFDHWRADLGLLDLFDDNDPHPGEPFRTLPCNRGCVPYRHLHFVRDRLTPATEEALDTYDLRLRNARRLYREGLLGPDATAALTARYTTAAADTIEETQP